MPTKPWFPTFIYYHPLQRTDNEAFARSLLGECRTVRQQDRAGRRWCKDNYPGGYTSYGTLRTLNRTHPSFAALQRKVWPHVKRFARRLDMDLTEAHLAMTDCWVNIMSRDAVHPLHAHPGAVVSGTYYVSTPPGCAGIHFEDPRLDKFAGMPPRALECRPENQQKITYPVEAGRLILFESWLRHGVEATPARDERVTVSFNYTWV